MANNLSKDPIELTDAGNPINVRAGVHTILKVEWVQPLNYADVARLFDVDGNIICNFFCTTPNLNLTRDFERGQPFMGPFNLSELDSGTLLIYRY